MKDADTHNQTNSTHTHTLDLRAYTCVRTSTHTHTKNTHLPLFCTSHNATPSENRDGSRGQSIPAAHRKDSDSSFRGTFSHNVNYLE